jgi:hypothetical protein
MDEVKELYKTLLCELLDHYNIGDVVHSLNGKHGKRLQKGLTKSDIMGSEYALS